jgi:hypothetical protein
MTRAGGARRPGTGSGQEDCRQLPAQISDQGHQQATCYPGDYCPVTRALAGERYAGDGSGGAGPGSEPFPQAGCVFGGQIESPAGRPRRARPATTQRECLKIERLTT